VPRDTSYPRRVVPSPPPLDLVDTLADLARLELSREEAQRLGAQLETILGYVRTLAAVDIEGVPEYLGASAPDSSSLGASAPDSSSLGASAPDWDSGLRADVVAEDLGDGEQILAGVPVRRGRLVAVPKFKD
jgi:Asp-tRNA(Asn)/Glu-tRNA(Gln) amidotransferase C subunit